MTTLNHHTQKTTRSVVQQAEGLLYETKTACRHSADQLLSADQLVWLKINELPRRAPGGPPGGIQLKALDIAPGGPPGGIQLKARDPTAEVGLGS